MFGPLRGLLYLGGAFPQGYGIDRWIANIVVSADFYYLCLYAYRIQTNYNSLLELGLSVGDISLECISGMMIVRKIFAFRQSFIELVGKCLVDGESYDVKPVRRFEIFTFLTFCTLLVLRIYLRSVGSGQLTSLHDTIMGLLYIPCVIYLLLAYNLNGKFSSLNKDLEIVTEAVKYQSLPTSYLEGQLALLFRQHLHLKNLRSQVDSFFGLFNAILISSRVVYLTVALYDQITIVCDPTAELKPIDVVVLVTASFFQLVMCDVCYRCSEKAMETVLIAHAIVDRHTPPEIMDQIKNFSMTMFHNRVIFSAAGVFNINRELITKITLATVTCLIIAIQVTSFEANKSSTTAGNTTHSVEKVI